MLLDSGKRIFCGVFTNLGHATNNEKCGNS
jgi:hypothetical protein